MPTSYGAGVQLVKQISLQYIVSCAIIHPEAGVLDPMESTPNLSNWVTQVRKGLLEFCIFRMLEHGEMHGYDLVKRLAGIPGLLITEGTAYPLLARLKQAGLLSSRLEESPSGPARKYYALTLQGREMVRGMTRHWRELTKGIEQLDKREDPHEGMDT